MDSVFQFCSIGQEQVDNCFLRVSSLHVMYFVYIIHMVPPEKKLPKSRGQNVRETL